MLLMVGSVFTDENPNYKKLREEGLSRIRKPWNVESLTVDDVKNATMEVVDCELGTVPFLTINAKVEKGCTKRLYHYNPETEYETAQLKLIPYYAWANRGAKDMMVWFHQL